jgi:hypothetical protein
VPFFLNKRIYKYNFLEAFRPARKNGLRKGFPVLSEKAIPGRSKAIRGALPTTLTLETVFLSSQKRLC